MNNNYFEKCQLLMNKLSKQNKQMIKLQVDFADLEEENEKLKQQNYKLIRLIEDLGHEEMERQMEEILND